MRRLLLALVLPALLAVVLVLPATAAAAAPAPDAAGTTLLLATEGHGEPLPGNAPRQADDPDNEFAPDDYEANFLWGAAVGLFALMAAGAAGLGGLYWLLVVRPRNQEQAGSTA